MNDLRMNCPGCGKPLIFAGEEAGNDVACPYCREEIALAAPTTIDVPEAGYLPWWKEYVAAFGFPFRQPEWPTRIGWLLVIGFIPVINLIVFRGWRLAVIRRLARQNPNPLPRANELPQFLLDGVILCFANFVYLAPGIVIAAVYGSSLLEGALEVIGWILDRFQQAENPESFVDLLGRIIPGLMFEFMTTGLYLLLYWPVHRTAVLLFAVTGKVSSFFNAPLILRLLTRNVRRILLLLFFTLGTTFLISLVEGLLVTTFIGVIVVPLMMMLNYWVTACLYGRVARRFVPQVPTKPAA